MSFDFISFSSRSIRSRFLIQLFFASVALITLFSTILYLYIKQSIYDEKNRELIQVAQNICASKSVSDPLNTNDPVLNTTVELVTLKKQQENIRFFEDTQKSHHFLILTYPYNLEKQLFLKIRKDITPTHLLIQKVKRSIFVINILGFILIIFYALTLSKMLIYPIQNLSKKLSNMNEHLMKPISVDELPEEFMALGETLNHLIHRIQTFVKYQKELFIGAAHELKTPLAVMKLKNQVTLIKKREANEYIDAVKQTNTSIDEMNKIVSNILNIGRQEGAQLEKPQEVDVIAHLKQKARDFSLLSEQEQKKLLMHFEPDVYMATLQVTLLNQIIQNFLQNALKFTPQGKSVTLQTRLTTKGLAIEVIDEGCGIDDSVDLFAPFKRQGNKSGAGLGLFLAKSAADAIGATIELKNRDDGPTGTIATIVLNSKLCCPLPFK